MSNVIVAVVTTVQDFPAGTVDTLFTYDLKTAAGVEVATQTSSSATDTFANVASGDYVVTVTKNGKAHGEVRGATP